jgi:MYXO-CTERM domain-containing protein
VINITLMRRRSLLLAVGAPLLAACSFTAVLLAASEARAGDKVAVPCADDALRCATAPISFAHVDALPIEWQFDTGWTPPNSPLQVHLWAGVYASTRVSLQGAFVTSWEAEKAGSLMLETPGDPLGGKLGFHYGAEIGAQAAVHLQIAGQSYDWVGDIPYVPQFDFQVEAEGDFDAWGFPPGYSLSSKTAQQTLAQVSIGSIIGASIPGIDGGFELDVAMELTATYTTTKIVMTEKDMPVSGGPILSEDGVSSMLYSGGAFTEVDVHPEGTVDYDGTLHLIPAFYVELLGQSWSIPIADIPMSFPITQTEWSFDPVTVHTPLPDLLLPVTEVDFGKVEVGQKNLEPFDLTNAGEAKLAVAMTGDNDAFEVWDPALEIPAGDTIQSAFRFVPTQAGEFTATVLVSSNDPDKPLQQVVLKGTGVDGPAVGIETEDGPDLDGIDEPAACACRTGGERGSGAGGAALFALGLAVAIGRSRRRR